MPESQASNVLQLHDKVFYTAWKGQLYIQDHLVCDIALQSPSSYCIPAQVSEKLDIKEVIRLHDLRKKLPQGIFKNADFTGQEVCCENIYYSIYQVLTPSVSGSQLDKLQIWMKDKDLAVIKFLNDKGFLLLMPSTVFHFSQDLSLSDTSSLCALFLFPRTQSIEKTDREEWESKFTKEEHSPKVTQLLPCLQYAIWETSHLHLEKEHYPDALVERFFKRHALLQRKKDTSSELGDIPPVLNNFPSDEIRDDAQERCSPTVFAHLQSYFSSPVNFCISLLKASTLVTEELSNSNANTVSSAAGVVVYDSLESKLSLAADIKAEAEITNVPKGNRCFHNSKKKASAKSRKGKSKRFQKTSLLPTVGSDNKSNYKKQRIFFEPEKSASTTSKAMVKLASVDGSQRRKRGAETLAAEFVQEDQDTLTETTASGSRRKKELPIRIMPARPRKRTVPQDQPTVSPRPKKRQASELANENEWSVSNTKSESPRKHAGGALNSKTNVDKLKKLESQPYNQSNNLGEVSEQNTKKSLSSPDSATANIFEKRINMYESHALNLLADLALNTISLSRIPLDQEISVSSEYMLADKRDNLESEIAGCYKNNPGMTLTNPVPCSPPHPPPPLENDQTLETKQDKEHDQPEDSDASQMTDALRPKMESDEKQTLSNVHDLLATATVCDAATSKICLEHSYSQHPVEETFGSLSTVESNEPSAEVVPNSPRNLYFSSEIITNDNQDLCFDVKNKESRTVLQNGDNFLITFTWETEYDFELDSKFTSDPLEKTINRALHGPWNPYLKEKVEDVKIILHMWLALFYSKFNKQLNSSSRKVVEHSNPAKYVSINTILDPFELYEFVESGTVEVEKTHLESSLDPSVNVPVRKKRKVNKRRSLAHTTSKSAKKKQQRVLSIKELSDVCSVLQQVDSNERSQECSKMVFSPGKEQEKSTCQTGHLVALNINAVHDDKEKSEEDLNTSGLQNLHKAKVVPLQDPKKKKPNIKMIKASFLSDRHESPLERLNLYSRSPECKTVDDANGLPLLDVDKKAEGNLETTRLSLLVDEDYELDRTIVSTHSSESKTLVHSKGSISQNEKGMDGSENENECTTSAELDATNIEVEPLCNITIDMNADGKHDTLDVSLQKTKINAAAPNQLVYETSSNIDLEIGVDSKCTVSHSSSLSGKVCEPLNLSPLASDFSNHDGKAETGNDINSFNIVSLVTGRTSETEQESDMAIITERDTEVTKEDIAEDSNFTLSDNKVANSELSETTEMDVPNIHGWTSLCENEEPTLSVDAQDKTKAFEHDGIDFNPSGKACDNCADDFTGPQENHSDFMGKSVVTVQTKHFAEVEHEESTQINDIQNNEESEISAKDVGSTASASNENKMDGETREEPEISDQTSRELQCPMTTADPDLAVSMSVLNASKAENGNENSMEVTEAESDQPNKFESKVSPVACVEHMERDSNQAEEVMCHDGLESQDDATSISDDNTPKPFVCYKGNDANVSIEEDNECAVPVYCLKEKAKQPDVPPNSSEVNALGLIKFDVIETDKSDNDIAVGSEKSDINTFTEETSYLDNGLVKECNGEETGKFVQNNTKTVDCNLKKNTLDSHDHQGPLDPSCAEISGHSRSPTPNENIISPLNPMSLEDACPVYANQDKSAVTDLEEIIVVDKHKDIFNPSNEGLTEIDIDRCSSDITDLSFDCTSPDRDNTIDSNKHEVIVLDSSLSAEESESAVEASGVPDTNKCTPPAQGEYSESIAQSIIQEHSDICFIASTTSISEEQYEHWSETSHKDIPFIKGYEDHQDKIAPGRTIWTTPPREPDNFCPSSPTENIMAPHEPTYKKKAKHLENQSDTQSLWDKDEQLTRYHRDSDHHCSRSYRNFTITHNSKDTGTALHTVHRDTCVSGKSALGSLFFNQRIISDDLTQNTLDMEHLRFIHRLKGVLRNAHMRNFYQETPCHTIFGSRRTSGYSSPVNKESPLLITIHRSSRRRDQRRHDPGHSSTHYSHTWDEEELVDRSGYYIRTSDKVRTSSPFHFRRLKYDNGFAKSNSDISGILKECVHSNRLKLNRVGLGHSVIGCTEKRELADAFLHARKTFVPVSQKPPAVRNIIADVCTSLHYRLQNVAKEHNRWTHRFYIHETNDDPFFSTAKSLLKEKGYSTVDLQHFCNSKHTDSDNLLIVIRNEDISSHIHKIPHLLQLKLLPNVSFAGVDSPEDITDSMYEKLFQDGGFVVSDQSVLETMSLGTLKEVAAVLEKLNYTSPWKWLIHFRENRKLKEDKREESVSQMKIRVLKAMGNVEILPYHQCDSRLSGQTETLACIQNLQSQRIHSRLAVYLTDKHSPIIEELEHNGILVCDVDTFLRRILKLDAQLHAFCRPSGRGIILLTMYKTY